eukprot:5937384-Prymnesium_polylepis.1
MEPVMEALSESLPGISGVANAPGCTASTAARSIRNPRTAPLSASVRAQTSATSAIGELVIHVLLPERTHSRVTGSHTAFVFIPDGSEPWSGSVSPKQPTFSPAASAGSHCSFCSVEPKSEIGCMTREDWTDMAER